MRIVSVIIFSILTVVIVSCSCSSDNRKFVKSPIDTLIKSLNTEKDFSIILYDMDYDEDNDEYKHQYQTLIEQKNPDTILLAKTPWYPVSDILFQTHVDDMGMELVSKKDGVLKKAVAPAGYSNHIGNEKYGQWSSNEGGSSFWAFYGRYAMMSSFFNLAYRPAGYGGWNDYNSNYRGYGRTYYGNSGTTRYGTSAPRSNTSSSNHKWSNKPNSFKEKVRSRVSTSASRSSKTARSSSRYSSSSSSRARSGGSGK